VAETELAFLNLRDIVLSNYGLALSDHAMIAESAASQVCLARVLSHLRAHVY
jgi:hypothetical protein